MKEGRESPSLDDMMLELGLDPEADVEPISGPIVQTESQIIKVNTMKELMELIKEFGGQIIDETRFIYKGRKYEIKISESTKLKGI